MSELCFNCRLPDCDERDSRCAVRRAWRNYCNKIQTGAGANITPQERQANNVMWQINKLERLARASEVQR